MPMAYHKPRRACLQFIASWRAFNVKFVLASLLFPAPLFASDVGSVRGVVHDSQHLPIAQAGVELKSATSEWSQTSLTDSRGEFSFMTVPLGDYVLTVNQTDYVGTSQA